MPCRNSVSRGSSHGPTTRLCAESRQSGKPQGAQVLGLSKPPGALASSHLPVALDRGMLPGIAVRTAKQRRGFFVAHHDALGRVVDQRPAAELHG